MKTNRPFVISSNRQKYQIRCCGCKSLINADHLRLGVREYNKTSWFHYGCFWTNCYYRNHLKETDGQTLFELLDGFSGISQADKTKLLLDCSGASTEKAGPKFETPYKGCEADGDYELDENTFDLTNLACICVFKLQTNPYVSVRKYFIPRGCSSAKPTKVGICLNREQWAKLESQIEDINCAIKTTQNSLKEKEKEKKDRSKSKPLNELPDWILFSLSWKRRVGVFASGDEAVIDIREFSEEKTFSESSRGIRLSPDQWKHLVEHVENINICLDKLG